ncbi:DUF192 domain-containing protein [Candidatus Woesearchaeota archaeon]|nr:DUF192 domain-containing protein [Candidatus Woesearchaeota archaeon]MCF7901188.1 DUF192 domain-containing protein [Candidatus Woesearchaeota archaeon]MCF8013717.1 DUF192 domain-containing protein [Candidatus Woesearchaeota archaeon]
MLYRINLENNCKEIITKKVVIRRNVFSQGTGLMFHKKIFDEAHIFPFKIEKIIPITNWFVFFPIDLVFLNKNFEIVELKNDFKPFTNYFPKNAASVVVELPCGFIKKFNLKLKDGLKY